MRQRPWDLSDCAIPLMNSPAPHSLPKHGRQQSRPSGLWEGGRQSSRLEGDCVSAKPPVPQAVASFPSCRKHFLQHTAFLRWCPSLTSVLLMCLLEISRTGFLFICLLCKQLLQASGASSGVVVEESWSYRESGKHS